MEEVQATTQMDKRGRLLLPVGARRALGINGDAATVTVTVEVVEEHTGEEPVTQ